MIRAAWRSLWHPVRRKVRMVLADALVWMFGDDQVRNRLFSEGYGQGYETGKIDGWARGRAFGYDLGKRVAYDKAIMKLRAVSR